MRSRGAEIVVVSIHVSVELRASPTPVDRALVQQLTSLADVDAVFIHGPHAVQPFEIVNGTPVWLSLGNFVSEMGPPSVGRYADARTADGPQRCRCARLTFQRGCVTNWWPAATGPESSFQTRGDVQAVP